MKILVTGNMGYVGPVVVRHLRGVYPAAELIGYDSGLFGHCLTTRSGLPEVRLSKQIFGDVRDIPQNAFQGVDAVVHLAAISNDPMGHRFEAPTDEINYRASIAIAERAREAGVKNFVFASSCSVYGFAEGGPRRETDPLNPLTAYSRSKIATELALKQIDARDMVITCLRFATACGMSERLRLDLVLNDFVAAALAAGEITVLSDGSPWRPLIDVNDMARAIIWAIERPVANGGQYLSINAGSESWNFQVRDLAEAVAKEIPGTCISINRNAPPDKRSYQVDFSKFKTLAPEHQPRTTLQEAIQGVRDGLKAIRFNDADFRNSEWVRLRVLDQYLSTGQLSGDLRWS